MISSDISVLLENLEQALKMANLWDENTPRPEQLASTQPFCIDTLSFEQWLQFIFLPRMQLMISTNQALPTSIALCPMAEEAFVQHEENVAVLINAIADIDEALSGVRHQTKYIKA